ncbi:hypothetical protein LTR66_004839 [Elasticomyces elasticus]|nr:hypothetical protein LTR66_004839 [Elasticomyces elasticus]
MSSLYFVPAWQAHQRRQTLRTERYQQRRKRKRDEDDLLEDREPDQTLVGTRLEGREDATRSTSSQTHPATQFIPQQDTKDPYHVAGHEPDMPLPPFPFPHTPAETPRLHRNGSKSIEAELAALKPPLYFPPTNQEDGSTTLRQKQLGVLTTILHHSLLHGNYMRAARAWGMVLRAEFSGHGFDGAEKHIRVPDVDAGTDSDAERAGDEPAPAPALFTEQGFKAAREYYDRLILQYPPHKSAPNAINALTFYPVMFGLWIYEVQYKTDQLRGQTKEHPYGVSARQGSDCADFDDEQQSNTSEAQTKLTNLEVEINREETKQARQIAARLDELLLSPPYDTHVPLLRLRGMVSLWLIDLLAMIIDETNLVAGADVTHWNREQRNEEVAQARKLFQRMEDAGGNVPRGLREMMRENKEH